MKTQMTGTRRMHDTAEFTQHRLSNGITVWLQKSVISISDDGYLSMFFKGVGSATDPHGYEGLAHFLEHVLFRRSDDCSSESELVRAVIENGGRVNAVTEHDYTEYLVEISENHFGHAAKTLSALVNEPRFEIEDICVERKTILQEIRDHRLTGEKLITQHTKEFLYGKENPFVHIGRGYPSSLERITQDTLQDFHTKHYHAGNAHIVCGGSFSTIPNILDLLENMFGNMRQGAEDGLVVAPVNITKHGCYEFIDKRYGIDELSTEYLLPYLPIEKRLLLWLLFKSLASDFLSPLWIELREKRGLVYDVSARLAWNPRVCRAGFECTMPAKHFNEAREIFFKALAKVDEVHLVRYFRQIQEERTRRFQIPVNACKDVADSVIVSGRPYSFQESEAMEDAIKLEEVLDWRDHLLKKDALVLEFKQK